MSRIFDALQRSKSEGKVSNFRWCRRWRRQQPPATAVETRRVLQSTRLTQFQSLAISVSPTNRLVALTDQASLGAEKFRFSGRSFEAATAGSSAQESADHQHHPGRGQDHGFRQPRDFPGPEKTKKVLLLEGDLRRPSLSTRFGLPTLPGLSEWLQGSARRDPRTFTILKRRAFGFYPPAVRPITHWNSCSRNGSRDSWINCPIGLIGS